METKSRQGSVASGVVWMMFLSLLLFWLPLLGALIAGVVGGKKAGGVGPGVTAAVLPAIALAIAVFVFASSLTGIPIVGAVLGAGSLVLVLLYSGPLIVGAIIGGLLA